MNQCNWAYSATCDEDSFIAIDPTKRPTPKPAMSPPSDPTGGSDDGGSSPPEGNDVEIVSLSMHVTGLRDDHNLRELEDQMLTVTERTVLRASDRVSGLKVTKVEPTRAPNRNLRKTRRALKRDVTQYFNVHVVRNGDKKFGSIIIKHLRDSKDESIAEIQ